MSFFYEKDERVKLIGFFIALFIIQGLVFCFVGQNMLQSVSNKYIKQNLEVIGTVNSYSREATEKIAPIITGKETGDYNLGKSIMEKYSYSEGIDYNINPLFNSINNMWQSRLIWIVIISLIVLILGAVIILSPLFKEINFLTNKAENIVEGRGCEKTKRKYNGSLNRFITKFNLMEERIDNSITLLKNEKINLKNIINDISHQLKTPLMALSMYNDILKDHRDMKDEEVDEFINLSQEQLSRMDWLVKTLLKYARLESNVVVYDKEYFSLNNTIEESINPLKIKASEKNQEIVFNSKGDTMYLHDRKWLSEAFSNIIKNAIEHTDYGGKIEIALEETPISIRVAIKDNGEGIDEGEIKRIFNRFYKGQTSINPTSIGIGLCLSRLIVNAHNGDITVESEKGLGTSFYITFLKTI